LAGSLSSALARATMSANDDDYNEEKGKVGSGKAMMMMARAR
jgi:hypothetical protein